MEKTPSCRGSHSGSSALVKAGQLDHPLLLPPTPMHSRRLIPGGRLGVWGLKYALSKEFPTPNNSACPEAPIARVTFFLSQERLAWVFVSRFPCEEGLFLHIQLTTLIRFHFSCHLSFVFLISLRERPLFSLGFWKRFLFPLPCSFHLADFMPRPSYE